MYHGAGLGIGKAMAGSSPIVSIGEGDDVAGHSGSPQGSGCNDSGSSSGPGQVPRTGHALPPAAADGSTDLADGAANGAWGSNRSSSDRSDYSSHEVSGQSLSTTTSAGSECMHGGILHQQMQTRLSAWPGAAVYWEIRAQKQPAQAHLPACQPMRSDLLLQVEATARAGARS